MGIAYSNLWHVLNIQFFFKFFWTILMHIFFWPTECLWIRHFAFGSGVLVKCIAIIIFFYFEFFLHSFLKRLNNNQTLVSFYPSFTLFLFSFSYHDLRIAICKSINSTIYYNPIKHHSNRSRKKRILLIFSSCNTCLYVWMSICFLFTSYEYSTPLCGKWTHACNTFG